MQINHGDQLYSLVSIFLWKGNGLHKLLETVFIIIIIIMREFG